jgi:hypothetical protein
MAPKQPKVEAAAAEPDAKKAKTEEPKKEEEPKFQEPDAPKDSRPAMSGQVSFSAADTSLNVVPTLGGKLLTCLNDGAMSLLLAGARANVGQKSGRYMYEVKIVQVLDAGGKAKAGVRIGFSVAGSGLILGEDASSVYFTDDASFVGGKKRQSVKGGNIKKDSVIAVVLNLDAKSPNANTVALYKDGVAAGPAYPLPEELKGKALFPHVAYRGCSVRMNFGPTALKELPFKCRLLQSAAKDDVVVSATKDSKDAKYEVMVPVAFPDEGTFDWLDLFLEKNPQYVELSDRKIIEWAKASGFHSKGGGGGNNWKASNDKPSMSTGIQELDNMSVRKVINAVAPIVPRNYLIMEVKSNLIASERKEVLKKFNYPCYKKVARVMMGEPNKEFKALAQKKLLKDKQAKSDKQWQNKKSEAQRKRATAQRQKELRKAKAEAEKKRKAAAEEKKKKAEEEKAAKEGGDKEEKKEEEKKEETKDEPMKEEEEVKSEEEQVDPILEETEPPTVELTDEEKKLFFSKKESKDLDGKVMSQFYSRFSTPEADEGFDDIVYEWQKGPKADEYLKKWILEKKLTTRIEDLKAGKVAKEKVLEFGKLSKEWQEKLTAWKAAGGAKKKPPKTDDEPEEDIDIFSVADICDIGKGVPLFENFTFEDWALMKLRFQLCLMVASFKVDSGDADRAGIPVDHLSFYYSKYFGATLSGKPFGVEGPKEIIALIKETVSIKDGLVTSTLSDDLDSLDLFLKLTEEQRRERQRRIDAGDETARLKFTPPAEPKPAAPKAEAKPAATDAKPAAAAPAKPAVDATPAKGKGKGK